MVTHIKNPRERRFLEGPRLHGAGAGREDAQQPAGCLEPGHLAAADAAPLA